MDDLTNEETIVMQRKNSTERKSNDMNARLKQLQSEKDSLEKEKRKAQEQAEKIQVLIDTTPETCLTMNRDKEMKKLKN